MAKVTSMSEQFQHFLAELQDSFWGDAFGATKLAWKKLGEGESARLRDRYVGCGRYEQGEERRDRRHGY